METAESVAAAAAAQINNRSVRPQPEHRGGPLNQPHSSPIIPGSAVRLNEEQTAKLQSELDVVENNVLVMNELLNEIQQMDKMNLQSAEVKNDILLLSVILKV